MHSVSFKSVIPKRAVLCMACKLQSDQLSLVTQWVSSWYLPSTDMWDLIMFLYCFTPWAIRHFQCQIAVVAVKRVCTFADHVQVIWVVHILDIKVKMWKNSALPPTWINKLTFMWQACARVAVILTSPLQPVGCLSIFSVKDLNINHLPAVHRQIQYSVSV